MWDCCCQLILSYWRTAIFVCTKSNPVTEKCLYLRSSLTLLKDPEGEMLWWNSHTPFSCNGNATGRCYNMMSSRFNNFLDVTHMTHKNKSPISSALISTVSKGYLLKMYPMISLLWVWACTRSVRPAIWEQDTIAEPSQPALVTQSNLCSVNQCTFYFYRHAFWRRIIIDNNWLRNWTCP